MESRCRVCTSTRRTGLFYGSLVCSSCKIFFMRTVTSGTGYVCAEGGRCKLGLDAYTKCRACRFAMCLKANMQPELVGVKAEVARAQLRSFSKSTSPDVEGAAKIPRLRKSNEEASEIESVVPSLTKLPNTESLSCSYSIGLSFVNRLKEDSIGVAKYAEQLLALETYCSGNTSQSYDPFDADIDVPLEIAIATPMKLCRRTPMWWNGSRTLHASRPEEIRGIYCRSVLHYLDWASGSPELWEMTGRDRMLLLSHQYCVLSLLCTTYNTYKHHSDDFMFPNGFVHKRNSNADKYMGHLVEFIHSNLIPVLESCQIRVQEFCILKQIFFYSNLQRLSSEGRRICREARQKYEQLLVAYVRDSQPQLSDMECTQRVITLFSIRDTIQQLGAADAEYTTTLVMHNVGGLRGQLTFDLHLKGY